jgi:hypothetical protein
MLTPRFPYCLALAPAHPYCDFDWGWELAQLAADLVVRPEEKAQHFAQLDAMAERNAQTGEGLYYSIADHDREAAAFVKLSVVEREEGEQAALRFLKDHTYLHTFRERLIQHILERGELDEVKRLCTDWLEREPAAMPGRARIGAG